MRSKDDLVTQFNFEFSNASIVGMINDSSFFSGVIDAKDSRQFGAGMYRSFMIKVHFVYDIEENRYFFTKL
jgi:hypothetical protein